MRCNATRLGRHALPVDTRRAHRSVMRDGVQMRRRAAGPLAVAQKITIASHIRTDHSKCALSEPSVVERVDRLHVPHRERLAHACVISESGARELCLHHGIKEVMFDEERLFAFGEALVRQTSSIAEDATSWGPAGGRAVAGSGMRPGDLITPGARP